MGKYLDVEDFKLPQKFTVRQLTREIIDGRPRLVVYFDEVEKGLVLTRRLADEISAAVGPSKVVEEFFRREGEH